MQYPSVYNHPQMVEEFNDSAARIVFAEKVIGLQPPSMTDDDGANFQQKVPSIHWQLGTAPPAKGFSYPLHSPFFDFDKQVIPLSAAIHAQYAVDFLIYKGQVPLTWPWHH